MSKNLIEKLQELWSELQTEPTIKKIKESWKKFSNSEGFVATQTKLNKVADQAKTKLQQNPQVQKAWRAAKKKLRRNHTLMKIAVLGSALLFPSHNIAALGGAKSEGDSSQKPNKVLALSSTMRNLQTMHSEQQLDSICTKLIAEDNTFKQICADRSAELGEELLRLAAEV